MFNMAHMGLRLGGRANGVSLLHGAVSREMFADLWPGFDPNEVPISSVTNGVHGASWMSREIMEIAEREVGIDVMELGGEWTGLEPGQRRRALERSPGAARAPGRRDPPPDQGVGPAARDERGRTRLDVVGVRPGRAHDRIRPPRPVLQAADADAARPGPAAGAAAASRAPDPDRDRRQEPPGRRPRQAADRADGEVRRRPGAAAPHHVPARLRHRDGPLPLLGRRRLAEQPAAPARGVRHVRHEGRAQRRAQPVDPRRLVGRVVRRRERVGDSVRRCRRRCRSPRRSRGERALRPDHAIRSRRGSTTATCRASRAVGADGAAHAHRARPEGDGHPHGARLRREPVRARRGGRPQARGRRLRRRARHWPAGATRSSMRGRGSRSCTSSHTSTATRSSVACCTCGPRSTSTT